MARFYLGLFALVISSGISTAQINLPGKGPAYTEPPKKDASYVLMGEFVGPIAIGENEYESLAVQVRCIGGTKFEAVAYKGGLPGQANHQPQMTKMIGVRGGDFLILSGGPWAIMVEKDHCTVVARDGERLGRLDRVVRSSPTLGVRPPEGASVLFDGTSTDNFINGEMTKDGLLIQGADIKPMFQDFNLHLEFLLPYMPEADGQKRANSGIYIQSRYECQVLDSFALDRLINGLGALYQTKKPDVNMCYPPLVWQTYDIQFTSPRFAAGETKIRNATLSSWINGVPVQKSVSVPNKTGAGQQEGSVLLPIKLQNHGGDPVRYRNIWVVDRGLTSMPKFPLTLEDQKRADQAKAKAKAKAEQAKKEEKAKAEPKQKKKSEPKKADDKKLESKQPETEKADAKKIMPESAEAGNEANGEAEKK